MVYKETVSLRFQWRMEEDFYSYSIASSDDETDLQELKILNDGPLLTFIDVDQEMSPYVKSLLRAQSRVNPTDTMLQDVNNSIEMMVEWLNLTKQIEQRARNLFSKARSLLSGAEINLK